MSQSFSFGLPQKDQFAEFLYNERFFNDQELDFVRKAWDDGQKQEATINDGGAQGTDDQLRKSTTVFLPPVEPYLWMFNKLGHEAIVSNNQYFQFDILGFHEFR